MQATARAHSNIALVKYWGKRAGTAPALNLPAVGSISLTLEALSTSTTVVFDPGLSNDHLTLRQRDVSASEEGGRTLERVSAFLDRIRTRVGLDSAANITTTNNFPTGAGLASSASGFAALALAGARAAGLQLTEAELAALARQGSGSAARSVFGGFVELTAGEKADGSDCTVTQLADPEHWPLRLLVAITTIEPKAVGSTEGMQRSADTSPFYSAWLSSHPRDLAEARSAIATRDFDRLASITEHSCMKMHGLMMSTQPPLLYWNPTTVAVIAEVQRLRRQGAPVCFTIDAGPQVKVVCDDAAQSNVKAHLESIEGVLRVIDSRLGPGARLIESAAMP